jgi:aryl-alcohol dehydrogenase-like predicted oxidoreductase
MRTRRLGRHGPEVSALGLGCLSFGGIFGPTTEADSLRTLDAAWDAGITFLDVANIYGKGLCETVMGKWLGTRRHRPVIATKAGIVEGPPRGIDNSEAYLRAELEGSLRRLGIDHVDLFYAHRHDPRIPAEDLAGTMQRLQDEGKIGGYGLSEIAPYTLERAHAVHPVTAVQNEYSLWTRQPELGLIQRCARLGVAFVPFSPLARGVFGTPMADPATFPEANSAPASPASIPATGRTTGPETAEAFHDYRPRPRHHPRGPGAGLAAGPGHHIIPIPGTRTAEHLADWLAAPEIDLTTTTARRSSACCPSAGPGATATTTRSPPPPSATADAGNPSARPPGPSPHRRRNARHRGPPRGPAASGKRASACCPGG